MAFALILATPEPMNEFFDFYTLLFLVLAVVIFLRLRSVLGRRTGSERPPFDPYSANGPNGTGTDKVVTLPRRPGAKTMDPGPGKAAERNWGDHAAKGTPLADAFDSIADSDASFEPGEFLQGARMAYEMIVQAFAAGDRKALKPLLSREVYDGFLSAISNRESRGETVVSNFVGIDKAEITEAAMHGKMAHLTIRFVSQLVSATLDKDGNAVSGDPERITDVTDVWTFARDVTSRDPNWKLVATEAAS